MIFLLRFGLKSCSLKGYHTLFNFERDKLGVNCWFVFGEPWVEWLIWYIVENWWSRGKFSVRRHQVACNLFQPHSWNIKCVLSPAYMVIEREVWNVLISGYWTVLFKLDFEFWWLNCELSILHNWSPSWIWALSLGIASWELCNAVDELIVFWLWQWLDLNLRTIRLKIGLCMFTFLSRIAGNRILGET